MPENMLFEQSRVCVYLYYWWCRW